MARSHEGFGWALFAVAMAVFFFVERRLAVRVPQVRASRQVPVPLPVKPSFPAGVAGVLVVVGGLQWLSAGPAHAVIAPGVTAWPEAPPANDWKPVVAGADDQRVTAYVSPEGQLLERREYQFLSQTHKKELGNYGNDYFGGLRVLATRRALVGPRPMVLHEVGDGRGSKWLVAASYSVGGRHFATPLPAQIHYAGLSLRNLRSEAASVTLWRTACNPDCRSAELVLESFVAAVHQESKP